MTDRDRIKVGGLMRSRSLSLIGVMSAPDRPGLAAAVFRALGNSRLNVQFIVQCTDLHLRAHMLFCVSCEDRGRAVALLEPVAQHLSAQRIVVVEPVALISVFGPDFRERPGIAGMAFAALAEADINILAVSTSISTVTCVINDELFESSVEALNGVFDIP